MHLPPPVLFSLKRFKRPLGFLILFASVFFFFTEVLIPGVATRVEAKALQPVPDSFLEALALRRLEVFAFDELNFPGKTAADFDLEPGGTVPE